MYPIDFNPNSGSIDTRVLLDKSKQDNFSVKSEASSLPAEQLATQHKDFSQSEKLREIQIAIETSYNDQRLERQLKINDLKTQIKAGTYPILSDDPSVLKQAVNEVAQELIAFETQFQQAIKSENI